VAKSRCNRMNDAFEKMDLVWILICILRSCVRVGIRGLKGELWLGFSLLANIESGQLSLSFRGAEVKTRVIHSLKRSLLKSRDGY